MFCNGNGMQVQNGRPTNKVQAEEIPDMDTGAKV
jgi:hypothetical protein